MDRYNQILKEIEELQQQLKDPFITELHKSAFECDIGNLVNEAKRMTFHISMCEEDNLIEGE